MLYDPKWEVKADPFSLEALIGWLERQNPETQYCFHAWNDCLLAQWLRTIDANTYTGGAERFDVDLPSGFHYVVNGQVVNLHHFKEIAHGDQTFGAALDRARKVAGLS